MKHCKNVFFTLEIFTVWLPWPARAHTHVGALENILSAYAKDGKHWIHTWGCLDHGLRTSNDGIHQTKLKSFGQLWQSKQLWLYLLVIWEISRHHFLHFQLTCLSLPPSVVVQIILNLRLIWIMMVPRLKYSSCINLANYPQTSKLFSCMNQNGQISIKPVRYTSPKVHC